MGVSRLQDYGTTRPLISELTTDFTDGTDVEGRGKRGEGRWKEALTMQKFSIGEMSTMVAG